MASSPHLKLISLALLLASFPHAMASPPPSLLEEQAGALLAWKATIPSPPAQLQSWGNSNTTTRPCRWYGIKCGKRRARHQEAVVITEISLRGLRLRASLETLNFTALHTLTSIRLSYNQIRGSFPPALASSLPNLRHLRLQGNEISGEIPRQIKHLESLVGLDLSNNQLSGSLPTELGYLKKLVRLDFLYNNLTGTVPRNLGNCTKLTILRLGANQLSGYLPRELGSLVNLKDLQLGKNKLTGSIPNVFGNLTKLTTLYLWGNILSGRIPRELGSLVNLEDMALSENKLMGSIPNTFGNLTKLTILYLYSNRFSGHVPLEIGTLMNLEILQLSDNHLAGPLPPSLCVSGMLKNFIASNNNLNGPLPSSLINCSSLVRVRLERNQIEGDISKMGVYPNLVYMDLGSNKLFGQLSYHWGGCQNLTMLRISNNNLTGEIPASMGQLSQLGILDLSSNKIEGEIPSALGNSKNIFNLSIANNLLHGRIPQQIGELSNLELLDLSSNNLNGSIQDSIEHCLKLRHLKLNHNKFRGNIPSELGLLRSLQDLLDLSDNSFTGAIPSQLSSLIMLATLNLSHNELNGSIPSSFQSMKSLTSIDVSYNELEGPVPNNKLFQGAPVLRFMHNKMLCGVVKGLPPCNSATQSKVIFMSWHKRKKNRATNNDKVAQAKVFSIWSFDGANVFKQIVDATNDFSEMHCIGTGGYGSVYKARLATSEIFAVKKIHMIEDECCVSEHVFNREIEALVQIRDRNIVKLFGYCSSSQGRFLIYEYMERGDLAKILKDNERAIELDWRRRIHTVLDVIHALAYMHHDCPSPIVHRDITSNNILLDLEFRACISDFGTAKILNIYGQNLTRLAGTKGYLAPELAYTENVTEKCDLYSFGVLVLELFMGSHPGDLLSSRLLATKNNELCLQDLLDSRLVLPDAEIAREIYCILSVAIQCLEPNPSRRPTARRASDELSTVKACEDHVNYLQASIIFPAL